MRAKVNLLPDEIKFQVVQEYLSGGFIQKELMEKYNIRGKKEFFYSNLIASTAKTALLFSIAIILFMLNLAPVITLTAFGIMQFITAQAGGVVVMLSKKFTK
ncbi:MAG: hypothetical protein WCI04_02795 [archaeon]